MAPRWIDTFSVITGTIKQNSKHPKEKNEMKAISKKVEVFVVTCSRCDFTKTRLHKSDASGWVKQHSKKRGHSVKCSTRSAKVVNNAKRFRIAAK
jgi:hypothetical protein